jgi:phosphoribosyl 1,2-cyclic phosphodiesterase
LAKKYNKSVFLTSGYPGGMENNLLELAESVNLSSCASLDGLARKLKAELPACVVIDEKNLQNLPQFVEDTFTQKPGRRFIPAAILTSEPARIAPLFEASHTPVQIFHRDDKDGLTQFIEESIRKSIKIKFWGVRGSTPCANSENIYFGGNTSCVQVEIPGYEKLLILDSGTGIRNLGTYLQNYNRSSIDGDLFITHPHWDHIQGFPFFSPFYSKENRFRIHMPEQYRGGAEEILSGHLTKTFFPVTLDMLAADLTYVTQPEQPEDFGAFTVDYLVANHPTKTAIYRFKINGYTIIYAPDNELPLTRSPLRFIDKFCEFIHDCDLLIHDGQYDLEMFKDRKGWGHSARERVVELAKRSGVKRLVLTHHDPSSSDHDLRELSGKLQSYRGDTFSFVELAREGRMISLPVESE